MRVIQAKKILCVDDSNVVLLMERMLLQKEGHELLTASNGEEAVRKALAESPDLILLDVVMPRMTGIDACRRLREHESTRAIPIIFVTTRGEEANVELGFDSGCTDYIMKPIDSAELLEKVRNYLGSEGGLQ